MWIHVMSRSLNVQAENLHGNQYNEACFAEPDTTKPNEAQDFAFRRVEEPYKDEDEKNIKESITFTLIKNMFESTITKMELAVALPSLLLDPVLRVILTPDEVNIINDVFQCDNEVCSKCLPSQSVSENRKSATNANSETVDTSRFDHAICKVLKTLEKRIDVFRMSPRYRCISLPSALFLHHIRYLLEQYILYRMSLTPEQARNKELHYRKLWRCHKKATKDIPVLTCDLERQRAAHEEMLEDVVKRYKENKVAIDKIGNKCNQDIADLTDINEKKQFVLYETWKFERKDIQLALKNAMYDLEALKRMNKELEEDVRERKYAQNRQSYFLKESMVESELLAIIDKYDTEIGSRHQTFEELTEIYNRDKSEIRALENEIKRQEATYVTLVKRKEEAEMTRLHENLTAFQRERAAKFIQRWWRKVFRGKKKPKRRGKRKRK